MADLASGDSDETVGRRLRHARVLAQIKQYQVAQELGIAPTTVADWEGGRRRPKPEQERAYHEALDLISQRRSRDHGR